ncbi:hypothetical protein LTR35_000255 [Friedmanniomyces endolithicus]|uniref:DUF6697 domain-containing protein n=1 Tax=Friedmanniomyces endolithicus TaxID=329885 RepID=A0AAN6FWJ7_9PEZI|nr:hypothetical protein LTS00_011093 [Friedmanniomyces endolithicus]KAK0293651.1 hypothetical protein LTR35_000255 [Friedmanniomyces endolithicus]KAK0324166.1 hypothetical protein LTR82_004602 [Friedmanniomyces endolithicus]KAK0992957.1 hypothetical protein LTR54_011277 [Friedmanniomyces endolithicus]
MSLPMQSRALWLRQSETIPQVRYQPSAMVFTHEFDVYHYGMTNTVHHGLHGSAMHRQKQGTSLHPSVPRFDPTVAGFRPNDMDVALYTPPPMAMPTSAGSSCGFTDMERCNLDSNMKYASEIARIDYYTHRTKCEMNVTNHTVQILQTELRKLREEVRKAAPIEEVAFGTRGPDFLELVPPREIMLKRFEPHIVAQVFTEQAELAEKTAKKLRSEVNEMLGVKGAANDAERLESIQASPSAVLDSNERTPDSAKSSKLDVHVDIQAQTSGDMASQTEAWRPLAVRQMSPPPALEIPLTNRATFTWEFLAKELGGSQWSPSFYFISANSKIQSQTYWLLEREWEPFLPSGPGLHGAKLSPVFNDSECEPGQGPDVQNFMDVPMFVMEAGSDKYTYYGQYNQPRYSDKLDYDRVMEAVPEKVRQRWAKSLADPGRPAWVTKTLMEHFWPRPKYDGPLPTDSAVATPTAGVEFDSNDDTATLEKVVLHGLTRHAEELKKWEKNARVRVNFFTAEDIMQAYSKADADVEPGMRLWWEYLECVGYKQDFYDILVKAQDTARVQKKMRRAPMQMADKTTSPATAGSNKAMTADARVSTSSSRDTFRCEFYYDEPVAHWEMSSAVAEPRTPTPVPRQIRAQEGPRLIIDSSSNPSSIGSGKVKGKAVDQHVSTVVHSPDTDHVFTPEPQTSLSRTDRLGYGRSEFVDRKPPTGPRAKPNPNGVKNSDIETAMRRFQQATTKAAANKATGVGNGDTKGGGSGSANGNPNGGNNGTAYVTLPPHLRAKKQARRDGV